MTSTRSPGQRLRIDPQTPHYKWLITGVILLASATQIFAGTSLNLAIPRLMVTFGTDLAATQWVATGFLVTRTLVIPLLGWLGSMLGNRRLFVVIMIGFVLTSLGCGLSSSLGMLVAFRLLQGAVMGPMEGLTAVILVQIFPPQQRGLAVGLRSIGWSTGELLFYTIGAYCLENISWRFLLFLGVPSGILSVILGWLLLPRQEETRNPSVDYPGIVCLGGFLVPLLLTISFARNNETAMSTLMLLGAVAVLGGGLFVLREFRAHFPAVNLRLFRYPTFCLLCGTAFFNNMGLFGGLFMVPIFLQQVIGLTPLQASLLILPALPFSAISGPITGRLSDVLPAHLVALGGLLTLTVIFYAFASVSALIAMSSLVGYLIFYRTFMDTVGVPVTALTVQALAPDEVRMGQGLLGVIRSIGASLGVTVISVFFERRREWHQLRSYALYDDTSSTHVATVNEVHQTLQESGIVGSAAQQTTLNTLRNSLDIEAVAAGFRESFLLICLCFLCAMVPMLWLFYRSRQEKVAL